MFNIVKNGIIEGCTWFTDINAKPVQSHSFCSDNTLIKKLQPSQKKSKIRRIFEQFIKFILSYLTVIRPNVMKEKLVRIIRAGGPHSRLHPTSVTFGQLWKHYQQFLLSDRTYHPQMTTCVNQLEKDEAVIKKIQIQMLSRPNLKPELVKQQNQFIDKTFTEILKLSEGTSRLFMLQREYDPTMSVNGKLFCVISKKSGNYTLRLMGTGQVMSELVHEGEPLPLAGKQKVMRELCFENIPQKALEHDDWMKTLIKNWSHGEDISTEFIQANTEHLTHYKKAMGSKKDLTSCSDRVDCLFWNVITACFPKKNALSPVEQKRLKLRANLLTLYTLFQELRYDLKPHTTNYQTLAQELEGVSQNIYLASQKGYLSLKETAAINLELAVIEKELQEAKKTSLSISSKLSAKKTTIKRASSKNLPIRERQKVEWVEEEWGHRTDGVLPSDEPIHMPSMESIPPLLYDQIDSKEDLLKIFREMCTAVSAQNASKVEQAMAIKDIQRLFNEVPYRFFRNKLPNNHTNPDWERNQDDFWWDLTKEESIEVMEKINEHTKLLMDSLVVTLISQYDYESLMKMTRLVSFLNARTSGYWISEWDAHHFRADLLDERGLHRTQPDNLSTQFYKECTHWEYSLGFHWEFEQAMEQTFKKLSIKETAFEMLPISDRENIKWTKTQHCLIQPIDIEPQRRFLNELTKKGYHINEFTMQTSLRNWLRPIQDPYLKALHRLVITLPKPENDGYPYKINRNLICPEAYQKEPQNVFTYVLEEMQKEYEKNPAISSSLDHFTQADMKRLLHVLRMQNPQVELMAFMKESPHLMRNPNVRNFFDALLFDWQLNFILIGGEGNRSAFKVNEGYFSEHIQEEIDSLQAKIDDALQQESIQDPLLFQERVDTLLYYYEMKEKLRILLERLGKPTNQILSSEIDLEHLYQLCQERSELSVCLGHVARVQMRVLLDSSHVDHTQLFRNYAVIKGSPVDPMNMDPYFEEEMERQWREIVKQCEKENLNLNSFLDQLCYAKDLPLDGSAWVNKNGSIYRNAVYEVNLNTCEVSKIHSTQSITFLPPWMTSDPHFNLVMGENTNWRAPVQESGKKTLFLLNDAGGHQVQIEQTQDKFTIYKKLNIQGKDKWLQSLPKESLFASHSDQEIDSINASLPFFDYGIYTDPQDPSCIYCVDKKGEIFLKINVKKTTHHFIFNEILDYRSSPPTKYTHLKVASQIKSEVLDQLALFENKDKIILWNQKGLLKTVELPRYELTFVYEGGRLICQHPSFKGYILDPSATLPEKKGLLHALILEHPDPTKAKKLLVPEASALIAGHKNAYPEARGIVKFFFFLKNLYNLYVNGKPPEIYQRLVHEIDPHKKALSYSSFEIRAYTGEIFQKQSLKGSNILELVKQAFFLDKPAVAKDMLDMLQLSPKNLNPTLLRDLIQFIHTPLVGQGAEAALKIKLCMTLKKCLKQQKKLKADLLKTFNLQMMALGKYLYQHGRKIPKELQLTTQERALLARLYQKHDEAYYHAHIKVAFLEDGEEFNVWEPIEGDETFATHLQEVRKTLPKDIESSILVLEKEIEPDVYLPDTDLIYAIPRLAGEGIPLLKFSASDENALFQETREELPDLVLNPLAGNSLCETLALEKAQQEVDAFKEAEKSRPRHLIKVSKKRLKQWIHSKIVPQKFKWEQAIQTIRYQIEERVRISQDPKEQLAIYAEQQSIASFDELRKALGQEGHLEALKEKGRLPSTLDVAELKQQLIQFFEALSHRNAAQAVIKLADEIIVKGDPKNTDEWQSLSKALYRLLTIKRRYDAKQDPRLLIFEAQQFIHFKPLDGGLDQLDLLDALTKNPRGIIQAPTAAGKTAVLSVMRSLLKANGKILSIQKVLPSLYQQTHTQLQSVLEDLYGISIYPLQFNLKMPMTISQFTAQGKKIDHSRFKGMYYDLLETIKNKGCVLTDYKSFPLLEEMFFKISHTLVDNEAQGLDVDPLLEEHWTYLRKILILLIHKADENMDEFDQPNRPIQKIQLDLSVGSHLLPPFLIETSLEIFDILQQDSELGLLKNIQGDLSEETRQEAIHKAAETMAHTLNQESGNTLDETMLLEYLLGENEDILPDLDPLMLARNDRLALCKDQFSIYLPLTLGYKEGSRYAKSEDGSKIVPCYNGERHDAKFGTILEQVNYTIQNYLQTGVTKADVKPWILAQKQRWDEMEEGAEKEILLDNFHQIVPDLSFFQATQMLDQAETITPLIKHINEDPEKILLFLRKRLQTIHTSGDLISMDPQNIIDMSRTVSGISATMGAPETFHRNFEVNDKMNGQIQANMFYRLKKRAAQEAVIAYDPEEPQEMLNLTGGISIHAIIDGAGAFQNARAAANTLKRVNSNLEQVGYHQEDESIAYVGHPSGNLSKTGFFFSQQRTRGTDINLDPTINAILTLNDKDGMREYWQKEGRLRQERQRYILAMPEGQNIKTVNNEMEHAIAQDARVDAQDIFRKSKQELQAMLRNGKKRRLLEAKSLEDFIQLFQQKEYSKSFITEREPHYDQEGTYFQAHCHVRRMEEKPDDVLNALREKLLKEAQDLGLDETVVLFEEVEYTDDLLAKMPELVAPLGDAQGDLENELQIEQEQEQECEKECEFEIETQHHLENVQSEQRPVGTYPSRFNTTIFHSVAKRIHTAYSEKIQVTDAFLPFSRIDNHLQHQRLPFDEGMFRVGQIYFEFYFKLNTHQRVPHVTIVTIQDPLEEYIDAYIASYDIRTNRIVRNSPRYTFQQTEKAVNSPEFIEIVAQIKFFDGRLTGYSVAELAALSKWLEKNDPEKMKDHLLNQILRYRSEKDHFMGSQVQELFDQLQPAVI